MSWQDELTEKDREDIARGEKFLKESDERRALIRKSAEKMQQVRADYRHGKMSKEAATESLKKTHDELLNFLDLEIEKTKHPNFEPMNRLRILSAIGIDPTSVGVK